MGCSRSRQRQHDVTPEQKWDYISLNDFKSTNCFTPFAYGYLWFSLLLSISVYAVDTFTAVQLLVFNKWSSAIDPTQLVSFGVTKWVFSICIILSFINVAYEHVRARKIMNRGGVAECYLDTLVVRLESIRLGGGKGWKRFLVFAELTKSKKGAEYIALFSYFSLQSWIRVLLCSGPRQFVNALTLYSVYNSDLQINGTDFASSFSSFFNKIKALATHDYQQALVISGMLFTLVVWVFSFLSLLAAAFFFVCFLWHFTRKEKGGLAGYCERKATKRLLQIVSVKINKAIAEDERRKRKAEFKSARKIGGERPVTLKATLPNVALNSDNKQPQMPSIQRTETMSTLPLYTSRPGTPGDREMDALGRPGPQRTWTGKTSTSLFSARSPLVPGAADMATVRSASPAPTLPSLGSPTGTNYAWSSSAYVHTNYGPSRTTTPASNRGYGPGPEISRTPTNGSSISQGYAPSTYSSDPTPPIRAPDAMHPNGYRSPFAPGSSGRSLQMGVWPPPPMSDFSSERASPAPSIASYRATPMLPCGPGPGPPGPMTGGINGPMRIATHPVPPRGPFLQQYPPYGPPRRNMTAPVQRSLQHADSNGSPWGMGGGGIMSLPSPHAPPPPQEQRVYGADQARASGFGVSSHNYSRPGTANSQRSSRRPSGTRGGEYGNSRNQHVEGGFMGRGGF